MTMTPHTNCLHPATKAARAACRKARAARETRDAIARSAIRDAYYAGIDAEELLGMITQLGLDYDYDADIEQIIADL